MNDRPLAVMSSWIGLPSETFIYRHMTELLPGRTAVVVRRRADGTDAASPLLVTSEGRRHWRWMLRGGLYYLGMHRRGPTERMVEDFLVHHGTRVILSEYLNQSLVWLDLARRIGARIYAHAHGYDISMALRRPGMREQYRRLAEADGIITMSQVSRAKLADLGLDGSRVHVIPYGVDVPAAPAPRRTADRIRCLAVGRMIGKKAPLLTLAAFRRAREQEPALTLDFVGDGELFEDMRRQIAADGLAGSVTLHGSLPHARVLDLLGNVDIFLQHSRTDPETGDEEGLPVGILEAMAHTLPVVATRHAGIPEAVLEDRTGILVAEGDVDGMADAIVRLARDRALRDRMGRDARLRAHDHFSWEHEREALINLLGLGEYRDPARA